MDVETIEARIDQLERRVDKAAQDTAKALNSKDVWIDLLEAEIVRMATALDAINDHNAAARAAAVQHYGPHHGFVTRSVLERRQRQ